MANFAVDALVGALSNRIQKFLDGRPTADEKTVRLRSRLRTLLASLDALKEHVDPTFRKALEETEDVVDSVTTSIGRWESKGSMRKWKDGAKYAQRFLNFEADVKDRIDDLGLAVSASIRRKQSVVIGRSDGQLRNFEFEPADPPEERASRLGKGMFGKTHKVQDRGPLGVVYAMKIINVEDARDNGVEIESIRNEARMMQQLSHDNIVRYNCCFEHKQGREFCIVMEFVGGGTLGKQIGSVHEATRLRLWTRQLCDALAYMHQRRVLHRDIKPDNVLLTEDLAAIKLADLGLSSVVSTTAALRSRVGAVPYMGPQRAQGAKYGRPEDMWSVGVVVSELLTKTPIGTRCPAGKFFSLDGALVRQVVDEGLRVDDLLGGVARDLLHLHAAKRLSAAGAVVRLGGARPAAAAGATERLPGLSEEDEDDDDDAAETVAELEERRRQEAAVAAARRKAHEAARAQRAAEAKLEHEKALAEEQQKAEDAQRQASDLRRQQLELQLKRDTEAADRAQKTAEERRRIREADEALARQVAEAERRRREAEAAAEAEKTRLREAEAAQRRQREEEARATAPLSNEDALKLVQAAKSLEPLRGRAGLMTLDLSSLSLGVRGSIQGTLEPLRGLVKLTELELSGCWRLSGTLEPLRGLVNLTALSLSYCRQLTGKLDPLKDMVKLTKLDLTFCEGLSGVHEFNEPIRSAASTAHEVRWPEACGSLSTAP
eukprot:CAMPEP_0198643962 /NCGR_PEP_ID=MMETSP1467-20131203/299_1 /TAXON_ID=1462469 /ORGANISM="unid. sp., Strain CCMP2135" /LENGTH=717 /DNA_ID=CAMNT_0044379399 /DNA_START=598 /DNA_END=2749 /DNA_ORIENTATION=-